MNAKFVSIFKKFCEFLRCCNDTFLQVLLFFSTIELLIFSFYSKKRAFCHGQVHNRVEYLIFVHDYTISLSYSHSFCIYCGNTSACIEELKLYPGTINWKLPFKIVIIRQGGHRSLLSLR